MQNRFRYIFLYMALVVYTFFVLPSVLPHKFYSDIGLLINGHIEQGKISDCIPKTMRNSSGGRFSRGKSNTYSVWHYPYVTYRNKRAALGTIMLGEEWCKSNIGKSVPLFVEERRARIAMYTQYFAPFVVILLHIFIIFTWYLWAGKVISEKVWKKIFLFSVGMVSMLHLYEFYLW